MKKEEDETMKSIRRHYTIIEVLLILKIILDLI